MLARVYKVKSRRRILAAVAMLALLAVVGLPISLGWLSTPGGPIISPTVPDFGKLPLSFEPNAGQTDPSVRMMAHTSGGTLYFTPSEVVLSLSKPTGDEHTSTDMEQGFRLARDGLDRPFAHRLSAFGSAPALASSSAAPADVSGAAAPAVVRLQFIGANSSPQMTNGADLPGKVNYFIGNDPAKWHTDLPTYSGVTYKELYPGIDLRYEGTGRTLKGTYTVAPGADPGLIRWQYEGAERAWVDGEGNLQISVSAGGSEDGDAVTITEQAPAVWQNVAGRRVTSDAHYVVGSDGSISLALGGYEPAYPVIIDPILSYSTYLGGSSGDNGDGIAIDNAGNAYILGTTTSTNFPTDNPYQPTHHGGTNYYDAFVTKLNLAGSGLVYSTYLGGSDDEWSDGSPQGDIAVDGAGNAYVIGTTHSTDFPMANAFQPTNQGFTDAFVTKLNPAGSGLVYSTYLGGNYNDYGSGIAVDGAGNAYVTGQTDSTDFPIANAYQPTNYDTHRTAFVTKLNATGSGLVYSTYLGGSSGEYGEGIAVDSTGNAYVTGVTGSSDFPTANAFQPTLGGGYDTFVTKLNPAGSGLVYSTYLGGSDSVNGEGDIGYNIAVDGAGNAYVTGVTGSSDFPIANPYQSTNRGLYDTFVTKLNPAGSGLVYSTYLGGSSNEFAGWDYGDIAVDGVGNAYVIGTTHSTDFPMANAFQPTNQGFTDAFVTKLNATGNGLVYSTYLGGSFYEYSAGIVVDSTGNAYVTGSTASYNFPTANAFQPTSPGLGDAFVTKLNALSASTPTPTQTCPSGTQIPTAQGDDTYSVVLNTTCDVTSGLSLKIGRYYGNVDAAGHPLPSSLDLTVARQGELSVVWQGGQETLYLSLAGVPFTIAAKSGSVSPYRVTIDARALVLPIGSPTPGTTPMPGINTLSITHSAPPGPQRALVKSVTLKLPGMRPLVLAAGIDLSVNLPNHTPTVAAGYWNPELWDTYYPYSVFVYHPTQDRHASIADGAYWLAPQIEQLKREYGVKKVNILGHSMGGLWGREYALNYDYYQSVDNILMLGTPNLGSIMADDAALSYAECRALPFLYQCPQFIDWYENVSPAIQQLSGLFMRPFNRLHRAARGVTYTDLAGRAATVPTDGAVTVLSVQGLCYSNHLSPVLRLAPPLPDTVHHHEPQEAIFQDPLAPYYRLSGNHYDNNRLFTCQDLDVQKSTIQVEAPPVQLPTIGHLIQAGETQTTTLQVDNADSVVLSLNWTDNPTYTLGLTLIDPLGQVITPTSAYSGSLFYGTLLGVSYSIEQPLPGAWQAVVPAYSAPAGGEGYFLSGQFEGGIKLDPAVSTAAVGVGQQVELTSTLHDAAPVVGAAITASIALMTNGTYTDTIPLVEQLGGSGVYRGVFTPTIPGTYIVVFAAEGANNLGQPFNRLSMLQLQAASGAALVGTYSEEAYDPGVGIFQTLVISATAAITEGGQYRLAGRLTTTDGQEVANSTTLFTPTLGIVQLPLMFQGRDIGSSGEDGPYQVRDLYFSQIISEELTIASLPLVYTTTAYSRYDWPRGNVIQSGVATDQGIDTDNNGKYEYLQVSIPVDMRTTGDVYSATLNLLAADGSFVTSAITQNVTLLQGPDTLVMRFSGADILASGVDGPYRVEDLTVWSEAGEESYISVVLPQTEPYDSQDFEGAVLVGHVTWQGRPPQPNSLQQLPITLTLKSTTAEVNYPAKTTDANGSFTVSVGSLVTGTYDWRVKSPKFLANVGTVALTGQTLTTNVEMGLMRAGDCNNDNVITVLDFNILKNTFGKQFGDPGYDDRADFNGDQVVNVQDFTWQKGNFGLSGGPPIRPR